MITELAFVEDIIFEVSELLRIPVLVAALLALAIVLVELGALAVELSRRRRRDPEALESAVDSAREALTVEDRGLAAEHLSGVVSSYAMDHAVERMLTHARRPEASNRIAKSLADFDLGSLRRLERTRMLVRAGPALGLMGTLIPLSPALSGLARGDVSQLTDNLRVAFSITVLGLLIGAIAFGISLVRDRVYAEDLSDLEFIAASLEAVEPA